MCLFLFVAPIASANDAMNFKERVSRETYIELVKSEFYRAEKKVRTLEYTRSKNLQQEATKAFHKAIFIAVYRNELVEKMYQEQIETKPYKYQQWINEKFHQTLPF